MNETMYINQNSIMDQIIKVLRDKRIRIKFINGGDSEVGLLGVPSYPYIEFNGRLKKRWWKTLPKSWFVDKYKCIILMDVFEWDNKLVNKYLLELLEWANSLE